MNNALVIEAIHGWVFVGRGLDSQGLLCDIVSHIIADFALIYSRDYFIQCKICNLWIFLVCADILQKARKNQRYFPLYTVSIQNTS